MDAIIVNPIYGKSAEWDPSVALTRAEQAKQEVYCKFEVHPDDVVALAFTSYNAWAPKTAKFFKEIITKVATVDEVEDEDAGGRMMWTARQVIAKALCEGHGRVITELNRRNGYYPMYRPRHPTRIAC